MGLRFTLPWKLISTSNKTSYPVMQIIEIPKHKWFIAAQFHPEFTSTPRDGHPLFEGFVDAAKNSRTILAKGTLLQLYFLILGPKTN